MNELERKQNKIIKSKSSLFEKTKKTDKYLAIKKQLRENQIKASF